MGCLHRKQRSSGELTVDHYHRYKVNCVLDTVDNDSECGLAIVWCSGRDRLEVCIVKVAPPQIDVSSYRKIGTPIASSGGTRAYVDRSCRIGPCNLFTRHLSQVTMNQPPVASPVLLGLREVGRLR